MAKIRGFKPDLWTDEDFVEVSAYARLLWMGLWNFSCDNGHSADRSKQIKMRVLPYDDVNCAELLRELEAQGLIKRADGWITVPNLARHQRPDLRYFLTCEKEGCIAPPQTVTQREARRVHAVHTSAHEFAQVDGDGEVMVKGSDGEGKSGRKRPARAIPEDWKPNDKHQAYASEQSLDLSSEAFRFRNFAISHDRRLVSWDAGFTNWLSKAYPSKAADPTDRRPEGWR